ncbi:MAG TPA: hypothetical protein DCS07_10315, partial [Bdellovibrionales bacterium]|nr:hypothetical protein [Bdellovibrionales bacterium]
HSDGELSPSELVQHAATARLKAVALTDHDAISGIAAARETGHRLGVEVIAGCELSAYEEDTELHILGLYVDDAPDSALGKLLTQIRGERPARVLKIAEKLRELGVTIRNEDLQEEIGTSESPGRAHVAAVLVKIKAVETMGEAFARYLGLKARAYVAKARYSPNQIIGAIHGAGGVAVLAHPGQYRQLSLSTLMKKYPLDGIEIFHHSHPASDRDIFLRMAQSQGWLITGGSDYHGPHRKPGIEVGSNGVTQEELNRVMSRLKR